MQKKQKHKSEIFACLIFTIIFFVLAVQAAYPLDLSNKFNLDANGEFMYAVEDGDAGHIDTDTRRLKLDFDTNYFLDVEAGISYDYLVRVAGQFSQIEDYEDRYGGSIELFLSRLITDMPVQTGLKYRYMERRDRVRGDEKDQFHFVGFSFKVW